MTPIARKPADEAAAMQRRIDELERENAELTRKGQNLCQWHGTVLMQRGRLRSACKSVLRMIGSHQVYDKGAKQLIEKVLAETELDYETK